MPVATCDSAAFSTSAHFVEEATSAQPVHITLLHRIQVSTCLKIPALAATLQNHPDPAFVQFFIRGIQKGFHPGLSVSPSSSFECINQQSAVNDPEAVENLLAKEVREGFMIGLFTNPPFPTFCISPLGIATRKYSGKKRHHHQSLSSPW